MTLKTLRRRFWPSKGRMREGMPRNSSKEMTILNLGTLKQKKRGLRHNRRRR